jgi:hypothetical protein
LLDFVRSLGLRDENFLFRGRPTWDNLLHEADIKELIDISESPEFQMQRRHMGARGGIFLVKEDRTYYEMRIPSDFFHSLSLEWDSFVELAEDTRKIIYDALSEMRIGPGPIRYVRKPIDEVMRELNYGSQRHILDEEISASSLDEA